MIVRLPKIKSIQEVPDATLEEAALLAAYFSKARQSEKVEVDYTFRSQVRKPGAKRGWSSVTATGTVVNPQENRVNGLLQSGQDPSCIGRRWHRQGSMVPGFLPDHALSVHST